MSGIRCLAWRGRQHTPSNRRPEAEAKKRGKDGSVSRSRDGSLTQELGIHPRMVDLGPVNGNFTLEAKFFTTQCNGAIMGKMMAKEIYAPHSSPRGGRKMLVIRGGKLAWEVAGQGQLLGTVPINDGKVHKVAVVYSAAEDCFTLIVDGLQDGSGIRNVRDHKDCRWAMGNTDKLPSWSPDASNARFDTAMGAIAEVRWNGQLLLTGSPSTISKPAYLDGQQVEYYSRTHKVWMRGDMSVRVETPCEKRSELAVYDVVLSVRRQRRACVGLSSLRLPLSSGEPCDFYLEGEDRWVPARIHSAVMDVATPTYEVHIQDEAMDAPPIEAKGVYVRHRFPKDARVVVYRGLGKGWVPATVMLDPEDDDDRQKEDADPDEFAFGAPVRGPIQSDCTVMTRATTGPSDEPPLRPDGKLDYQWVKVCVCEDGGSAWSAVPAYLVRFHDEFLDQIAKEEALREYVQQELDALDCDSEPPFLNDPSSIAGLDDIRVPDKPKKRKAKGKEKQAGAQQVTSQQQAWHTDTEVIAI